VGQIVYFVLLKSTFISNKSISHRRLAMFAGRIDDSCVCVSYKVCVLHIHFLREGEKMKGREKSGHFSWRTYHSFALLMGKRRREHILQLTSILGHTSRPFHIYVRSHSSSKRMRERQEICTKEKKSLSLVSSSSSSLDERLISSSSSISVFFDERKFHSQPGRKRRLSSFVIIHICAHMFFRYLSICLFT